MTAPAAREPRRRGRWFAAGIGAGALAGVAVFALTTGLLAAGEPAGPAVPHFVEQTATAGMQHAYDGGFEFYVGGGVATFDCDDDGRPDVYLAGGESPAALYRNTSAVAGSLAFEPVPSATTDLTGVAGAYPLDVDGDDRVDLAVLRVGENVLLRGVGDCRFERANEQWGIDGGADWTAAFSATWEREDAWPTLAFGNYLALPLAADNSRGCAPSYLVRADGTGGYGQPLSLTPGFCALSMLFSDWDGTGRHDLRLTNDRHYDRDGQEQLWQVEEGAPPRLYTAEDGWSSMSIWGMGIAARDVTGDGLPEVVLTSQGDNKLQTLTEGAGRPSYSDIAIRLGTTAHRPFMGDATYPSTAWHPQFADVNNDGRADLFLSKGNVEAQVDHAMDDPSNLLLGTDDGFVERARESGVVSLGKGRGAALVDLNLDGLLDLVEVQRGDGVRVWRNMGAGNDTEAAPLGRWLAVQLEQPGVNRDAIGAWLEVRTPDGVQGQQVTVGGGHAGGQLGWVHVGLGDAASAQVRVRWPDGETGPWHAVEADRFVVLERDAAPAEWRPG